MRCRVLRYSNHDGKGGEQPDAAQTQSNFGTIDYHRLAGSVGFSEGSE